MPESGITAGSTPCGRPDGGGRAPCAGVTSPTKASSAHSTRWSWPQRTIGETDEEQRCDLFLRQLDPEWRLAPGLSAEPGPRQRSLGRAALART